MAEGHIATLGVGDDDLVTGEAVALELPAASIGLRILSGFLDYVILQTATYAVMVMAIAIAGQLDEALGAAVVLLAFVLTWVGYPTTMETLTRGRTLGKMAVGLRTVRDDAGPITFRHALTRALLGVVEVYLLWGVPAVVCAVLNPKSKRLGDIVAGTYVVRDRVRATLPPPVPMPPHLARWAASADIAALPDSLALAVRTFLPAAFTMTPEARTALGRELLEDVLQYVSPPPPPGNHPEYVLAAVVADRRRRDADRLARDTALRRRLVPPDPFDGSGADVPQQPPGAGAHPARWDQPPRPWPGAGR